MTLKSLNKKPTTSLEKRLSNITPPDVIESEVSFKEFSEMLIKIVNHPLYTGSKLKYLAAEDSSSPPGLF